MEREEFSAKDGDRVARPDSFSRVISRGTLRLLAHEMDTATRAPEEGLGDLSVDKATADRLRKSRLFGSIEIEFQEPVSPLLQRRLTKLVRERLDGRLPTVGADDAGLIVRFAVVEGGATTQQLVVDFAGQVATVFLQSLDAILVAGVAQFDSSAVDEFLSDQYRQGPVGIVE
jgi:hypothetical protein